MGERINQIRKKLKLSQKQLGEMLGVSGAYVSKVESNKEKPSDTFIYLFCKLFYIRKEWLLEGEDPITVKPDDLASDLSAHLDFKTLTEVIHQLTGK